MMPKRFPLLLKIIDAREKLSLQVHPPARQAARSVDLKRLVPERPMDAHIVYAN